MGLRVLSGGRAVGRRAGDLAVGALVLLAALLFLFPFYWMVTGAFKTRFDLMAAVPQWVPLHPTLENLARVMRGPGTRWFLNSVIASTAYTLLAVAVCTMAGYSLGRKRFPGRQLIFTMFVVVMAIPKNTTLVPLFLLVKDLGMVDRFTGLVVPFIAWPFGIFLIRQFTLTLPMELFEAARIDGASERYLFLRIVVPLVLPGIVCLSVFAFRDSWNDYFWQLIALKSSGMKTFPLGVAGLLDDMVVEYGLLLAGSAVASLPIILLFLAFQRQFTAGIAMSAIKG
jgi:multiple sugar transport system permease protein